ncbi:hypothetical protein SSTU70S_03686 [Stutzerimonas stutzeri]
MPYGEWITLQITSRPARNTVSTKKYMYSGSARSSRPNRRPRGRFWMPSSPWVNGACRQKKKNICDSARVIIVE